MFRLVFLLALLAAPLAASAQKVLVKSAPVAAGQPIVLDLKHATTIRIRPATDGKLHLQANVQINQNKLNDAFQLNLTNNNKELRVESDLDKTLLASAQPGDCPTNSGTTTYYGNWNNGQDRAPVCADIVFDISLPPGTALRVSTISGNIDVLGLTGELQAKSISGFVDVSWPATRGAQVALKTITGEVYTDQEVAFNNKQQNPIVGYEMRGVLGSASGPALRLESISGNVFFRKAK
ncbi:DUF4097 family beta strand repeat-containing protein [Hymenobacter puniceus]|uniref:hypothetical protein n=1 Tax=Hymenobacter sp. BT190 TaxID=2763505 RepID=UPI001651977B|nr:hypothetical protein [Hymenobacter sp. BT190]MBC6697098.1 hypothetical protein [Hymenobacter sp. BT190]